MKNQPTIRPTSKTTNFNAFSSMNNRKLLKNLAPLWLVVNLTSSASVKEVFVQNKHKFKCGEANPSLNSKRIFNGAEVPAFKYPWIVTMYIENFTILHCHGALITEKNLVTLGKSSWKFDGT
jgi:hypothetical protein